MMIDQNNEIIQELKNRPIKDNGYIHVARKNNYGVVIKNKTLKMLEQKKLLKFECYLMDIAPRYWIIKQKNERWKAFDD